MKFIQLKTDGVLYVCAANVQADVMIAANLKKKKGELYLHIKMVKSRLTVGHASANFDNLFNGDKTLSEYWQVKRLDGWAQL